MILFKKNWLNSGAEAVQRAIDAAAYIVTQNEYGHEMLCENTMSITGETKAKSTWQANRDCIFCLFALHDLRYLIGI